MSPLAVTIPDAPEELAGWLEEMMLRGDLSRFVAELRAIHGEPAQGSLPLERVCGEHLGRILRDGLAGVPRVVTRGLLKQPELLEQLNERILLEGGPYWDERLAEAPGMRQRTAASHARLQNELARSKPPLPLAEVVPPPRRRWRPSPWLVSSLTAAAVLAAVAGLPQFRQLLGPTPTHQIAGNWGWLKADELPADLSAPDYLKRLADLADEWGEVKPTKPEDLAQRIS